MLRDLATHILLVGAAGLLWAAGWRVASLAVPSGLARPVAAAVLTVAFAVVQALAVGLLGLVELAAPVALLTLLAARRWLPAPAVRGRDEVAGWWRAAGPRTRAAAGALVTLLGGWTAWQLQHPYISDDGFTYHLPLAASYVEHGSPGRIVDLIEGVPVANYPVTNEVALSWAMGLSQSWVIASVWNPLLVALLLAAGTLGLRRLRVPVPVVVAALAAFCALPLLLTQAGGPLTDLPAVTWLVVTGALAVTAAADRRPALLAIALVAAGLSFGTKTTGSVLLAVALLLAAWPLRGELRRLHRAWALLVPLAVAVGGVWVLRNVMDHGSPLWPLVAMPWGDEVPPAFAEVDDSFLSHPGAMLDDGRAGDYTNILSGGTYLLAGGLLAFALARTRATRIASAVVAVALLAWTAAPYTGIDQPALAVGATRYLLPTLAAATLALALAARDGSPRVRTVVLVVLGFAAVASTARTWEFGFPFVPSFGTVLGLAVLGAVAGWLLGRVPWPPPARIPGFAAPAAAIVVLGSALAVSADGYLARHAESGRVDAGLVRAALATPGFDDRDGIAIGMGPATVAFVWGEEIQHDVSFLASDTPCRHVREIRGRGWVVLQRAPMTPAYRHLRRCLGDERPRWSDPSYELYAG